MSFLTTTGFKISKRRNMRLNHKSGGAFDIQNNNGFIKPHGLKNIVKPLGLKQKALIARKIKRYTTAANKRLVAAMVLTLCISAGLIILAREAMTLL